MKTVIFEYTRNTVYTKQGITIEDLHNKFRYLRKSVDNILNRVFWGNLKIYWTVSS